MGRGGATMLVADLFDDGRLDGSILMKAVGG
jgi:hypothetical protein